MAIIINDNLAVNVGKPVDSKYLSGQTAWISTACANANIPFSYRYPGLTVNVNNDEYWYKTGLNDPDLILKQYIAIIPSGFVSGATNGLNVVNGIVRLGGTITGSTTLTLTGTSALIISDNRVAKVGIVYAGDYSSGFTNNSLVSKLYVDSRTSVASGERITKTIIQASHGFNVKDFIGWSGGTYNKAIANGLYDGEFIGIVSKCNNVNSFEVTQAGYVTGLTTLITNTTYFLSDATAGLITSVMPVTPTHITKAVMIADSTTSGWVLPYAGVVITSGTTTGALIRSVCLIPPASTYSMTNNDYFVGTCSGSTIILPASPQCGMIVVVADICNSASLGNPVTIVGSLVNGSTLSCINTPSGSLSYVYMGTRWSVTAFAPNPI